MYPSFCRLNSLVLTLGVDRSVQAVRTLNPTRLSDLFENTAVTGGARLQSISYHVFDHAVHKHPIYPFIEQILTVLNAGTSDGPNIIIVECKVSRLVGRVVEIQE